LVLKFQIPLVNIALSGKSKPDLPTIFWNHTRNGLLTQTKFPLRKLLAQKLRLGSVDYGHKIMARSGGEIRQP